MSSTKTKSRTQSLALLIVLSLLSCVLFAGCAASNASSSASSAPASSSNTTNTSADYTKEANPDDPYSKGTHHAVLTVDGFDPITITLVADDAPVTVSNFCTLANEGFYDGLNFYRFVADFCMQGGSSNNSAAAANDGLTPIIGEFSSNGIDNPLADNFKKGTVAMARNNDPNSATSTFFITLSSDSSVSQSLDGRYAAFGTIDEAGMNIVDAIVAQYLPLVTDPQSGSIADAADQARIVSIDIID